MIQFTNNTIIVTGETVSAETLYQACVKANLDWVKKLGTSMYLISKNLYIGHSSAPTSYAYFVDKNVFIQFEGNLFQVYKGSELRLGTKRPNGSTTDGCTLNAPYLTLEYGFGYGANATASLRDPQNVGNFYAYNSTINAYCFWAWFGGTSTVVELIDCHIDGFGRVEGVNSIVKNVTIKEAHYMYGMLTPKGQLAIYENINIGQTGGLTDNTIEGVAFYFNPLFAQEITVTGGVLKGYEKLMYTEVNPQATIATCNFIDTQFEGVLTRLTKDAKTQVLIKYTFKPQFLKPDGTILQNVGVTIKDKTGATAYTGVSDANGNIKAILTRYKHVGLATTAITELNPYTMTCSYNNGTKVVTMSRTFNVTTAALDFPCYIAEDATSTSTGSGGCDCTTISNLITGLDTKLNTLTTKVDTVGTNVNTINTNVNTANTSLTSIGTKADTIITKDTTISTDIKTLSDKLTTVTAATNSNISELINIHDDNIETKLATMHDDMRQIMLNVLAETTESQTIIQQKDGSRMIL